MTSSRQFERVLLYVGPPKTGSSSIEAFVLKNRDALIEQGVYVPMAGLLNSQHVELAAVLAQGAKGPRRRRLNFQAAMEDGPEGGERRERFLADLDRELSAAPRGKTVLFMSEAIFPASESEVRAYREVLSSHASRLESLMYLRRQDRWLASRTLQNRKVGSRSGLELNVGVPRRYASNIRTWYSESDRCHIRRFEPEFLIEGSLLKDFCEVIGAATSDLDMEEVRANPALLQEQLELVDALNDELAPMSFGHQAFYRTRFLSLTLETLGGTKIGFPRAAAVEIFESFREINQWLHETIDPDGPPLFFNADFSDYEETPSNDRCYSMEQLGRLLAAISPAARPPSDRRPLIDCLVSAFLSLNSPDIDPPN